MGRSIEKHLKALERAGGSAEDKEALVCEEALRHITTEDLRLVHAYLERAAENWRGSREDPTEEEEAAILRYEGLKDEVRREHATAS